MKNDRHNSARRYTHPLYRVAALLALGIAACSSERPTGGASEASAEPTGEPQALTAMAPNRTATPAGQAALIYRSTGAKQCEGEGAAVADMQAQLTEAGIQVQCSTQAHDGRMRPMVCGAPAGRINVFTVPAEHVAAAEALGYAQVARMPGAPGINCP